MDLERTARTLSEVTVRFRMLVSHFMSPAEETRLLGYRDGEAQLSLERTGKPAHFIVIIDGATEEERSLRLRIGRLTTEKVDNQHVVVVANHGWMPDALRKMADEFGSKLQIYQLNSSGELEVKPRQPLRLLLSALKAQRKRALPVAGVPVFTGGDAHSGLAESTAEEFAAQCERAESEKERLRNDYAYMLKSRGTPIALAIIVVQAALFGLARLWQSASDGATVLVQLGAIVPAFVRQGEWWRLLGSVELHASLLSGFLSLLVWLSLGTLLEKLLGSARFVTLHVLSGLGAALLATFWPRSALALIIPAASGAACGLMGAGAVLAVDPGGLPPEEAGRLRKIVLGGLLTTALLTLMPGVERLTHLGGALCGAVLLASGALRPPSMGRDGKLAESSTVVWAHIGVALFCGLLLLASLATSLLRGHPWKADVSWKKQLSATLGSGPNQLVLPGGGAKMGTAGAPGGPAAADPEAAIVRRALGDSGASIELPQSLGEVKVKAGRTPTYEFGDLGEKQQLLTVLIQRHGKPLRNKAQIEQAFGQAIAQVKADRMRDDRVTPLSPPARSTLDGWPVMEFAVRLQESLSARGLVQARSTSIIILWYDFTDLLPEAVQLDLKRALHGLRDTSSAPTGPGPAANKKKKGR